MRKAPLRSRKHLSRALFSPTLSIIRSIFRGSLGKGVLPSSKKAFGNVDWPISLGFFLVYLMWFFVIISPLAKTPVESEDPLMSIIEEKFDENALWELTTMPLIAAGNIIGSKEPIIATLPLNYSQENTYMYDNYFLIDEGKVFLLTNLSTGSSYWLIHTDKTYTLPSFSADLSGDSSYSQVVGKNFRADFTDALLTSATYDARSRITDFDILIDGSAIGTTDNNFTDNPMVHKYKVSGTTDNIHYVFADNSRIYSFITTTSAKDIVLNFTLDTYSDYYVSAGDFGTINYGSPACTTRAGDFVNFYDTNDAVTFLLGENSNITICNTAASLSVAFIKGLEGELSYHAIFHSGDKDEGLNFTGSTRRFGVIETIEGLSRDNLDELNLESYENLKNDWGFPRVSNFKILVYNSTSVLDNTTQLLEIGDDPYELAEVHAKTTKRDLIDKHNGRIRSTVNLRVWT